MNKGQIPLDDDNYDPYEEPFQQYVKPKRRSIKYVEHYVKGSTDTQSYISLNGENPMFKMFLALICCISFLRGAETFISEYIITTSTYVGSAGIYQVNGETREIICPDGSICKYIDYNSHFVIIYPNDFRMTVTPIGAGGGVTTYDSQANEGLLTPYIEANHLDVKNAMLTHEGFVTDVSPWKVVALVIFVFSIIAFFTPHKVAQWAMFVFIQKESYYHSAEYEEKVHKVGAVSMVICLVILLM